MRGLYLIDLESSNKIFIPVPEKVGCLLHSGDKVDVTYEIDDCRLKSVLFEFC